MSRFLIWLVVSPGLLVGGCARVPQEAIELSVTLGRDLAEAHRANRELAIRYFDRIEGDINTFVDEVYRPYSIRKNTQETGLIDSLVAASNRGDVRALDYMQLFVALITEDIEQLRDSLTQPVRRWRTEVLAAIDDCYMKLQNANSIVTGHLASVRKVHDSQAEMLDRIGVQDLRDRFLDAMARMSDGVAELAEQGRKGADDGIVVMETFDKLKDLIKRHSGQP